MNHELPDTPDLTPMQQATPSDQITRDNDGPIKDVPPREPPHDGNDGNDGNGNGNGKADGKKPLLPPRWVKVLKWIAIAVIGLLVIIMLFCGVAVWILTPERLTPLVEKYGSEYIDGEVRASRVELTYWSTWPKFSVDIDSLTVVSHSLRGITEEEKARIPANADTLLKVDTFHAGINLLPLFVGKIALTDVIIGKPKVNLVDVRPDLSNYNIFPTDTTEKQDTTKATIPDISIHRFAITGNAPIRYVSLPDTIDVGITLQRIDLEGEEAPTYKVGMDAGAHAKLAGLDIPDIKMGMGGSVHWKHDEPYKVSLENFEAGINNITAAISTTVDFSGDLLVKSFYMKMTNAPVSEFIAMIPESLRGELDKVDTDLAVSLTARLLEPYKPVCDKYPSAELSISMPEGALTYDRLQLRALGLEANMTIDGKDLNSSVFTLEKLVAVGEGVGFKLNLVAKDLMTDPYVKGNFDGGVGFANLPRELYEPFGVEVSGVLRADADFELRQSWLNADNFHRIRLTGEANLTDFNAEMPTMPMSVYAHNAKLKLGTSSQFVRGAHVSDSLLTASIKIDTIATFMQGLEINGKGLLLGAGAKNTTSSADTTQVNPIGAVMVIERLYASLPEQDSLRVMLRDMKANAGVKRFKGMSKVPELSMNAKLGRMRMADVFNRASVTNAELNFKAHLSPPRLGQRMRGSIDSIAARHPGMRPDSIYRLAQEQQNVRAGGRVNGGRPDGQPQRMARNRLEKRRAMIENLNDESARFETLDLDVDTTILTLMRQWRAQGSLKAEKGRLLTPYFPLRNRIENLDLTFSNDSIVLKDTKLVLGNSDFTVNGSITNLQRGLASNGRSPLRASLSLKSDVIDVNQLTAAAFAGAAFMARADSLANLIAVSNSDDDDKVQQSITQVADTSASGPLLLPVNLDASASIDSKIVKYADFDLYNLHGEAALYQGALNLRDLSASTDAGSVDLTALYEGVDAEDLRFAFGMKVNDLKIGHFLDLMPSLDTIMPLLRDVDGIINADVAAAADLTPEMDFKIPSLEAAVTIRGDSLKLVDAETWRKIGKWLLFKQKDHNVIDSMSVSLVVKNSMLELYPFMFNIDRYKLGVYGSNDLAMNYKYHVAVLKSPIPFKFGINVSGGPDSNMKIRLGGAKFSEKDALVVQQVSDTTRINLINQIEGVFRRGVQQARNRGRIEVNTTPPANIHEMLLDNRTDTISSNDSTYFREQGLFGE